MNVYDIIIMNTLHFEGCRVSDSGKLPMLLEDFVLDAFLNT